jgi:hypothetical protein
LASGFRWVAPGEEIDLTGAAASGQSTWWWLVLAIMVFLAVEMIVIAMPFSSRDLTGPGTPPSVSSRGEQQAARPGAVGSRLVINQATQVT